jgi:two-component system sensor histidine kinase KdpD
MVGNILDLSRLEAKAWKLKPELTPIAEILGMALDNFDKDANNRINVFLNPELKEVFADSTQLVQVIKNLVENALKYSPKDSSIEISTDIQDDMAIIEIKDRGRGLPANINNMFEPFWRASDLQESSVPGVGIGLAICRGLVEAHGGTILAKNRKDGGASFTVYLPMNTRK